MEYIETYASYLIWAPYLFAVFVFVGLFFGDKESTLIDRLNIKEIYLHLFNISVSGFSCFVSIIHILYYKGDIIKNCIFYVDALSIWFNLIVTSVSFMVSMHSMSYITFKNEQKEDKEKWQNIKIFYALFNGFILSMILVQVVNDLIILCVMMEITTLTSVFLVCYDQNAKSVEAAWKYICLCSLAMIFALIGTLMITLAFPDSKEATLSITALTNLKKNIILDSKTIEIAFYFVLIGFVTKAGLAPLHSWLPDSHAEAPSPVSALLSGVLLKTSFFAILRYYQIFKPFFDDISFIHNMFLMIGLLSLVIAVPFIIKEQENFKRILAYHSLNHMGIIFFATGLGSPVALFAALLHSFYHALTKALMFIAHGEIRISASKQVKDRKDPEKKAPLLSFNPLYGIMIALGGLALVGSPPFAIFTTEYKILGEAISKSYSQGSMYWPMIVATTLYVISLVFIFGGLTNHIAHWIIGDKIDTNETNGDKVDSNETKSSSEPKMQWFKFNSFPLIILIFFIFIFGFGPFQIFLNIIKDAITLLNY